VTQLSACSTSWGSISEEGDHGKCHVAREREHIDTISIDGRGRCPSQREGSEAGEELGPSKIADQPQAGVHQGESADDHHKQRTTMHHWQQHYG
jgi:hypothetical protein